MRLKNLVLLAAFSFLTAFFSCTTKEKSETTSNFENTDASNARLIEFSLPLRDTVISVDSGNAGGGNQQEFNADSASARHMFSREDNSDWYKVVASADTGMAFTIRPKNASDELDFVLFRAKGDDFSSRLASGTLSALRSNFNKAGGDGSTGLLCDPRTGFHGGDGNSMSRAFVIRKNETYYLVVNAPSGRSGGYDINFHACTPGEGNLSDFEGNAANPESEFIAGDSSAANEKLDAEAEVKTAEADKGKESNGEEGSASGAGTSESAGKQASGTKGSKAGKENSKTTGTGTSGNAGKQAAGTKGGKAGKGGETSSTRYTGNKTAGTKGARDGKSARENAIDYVVGEQETLYSIAFKMGMTVEELMALNGLKDTNIYPGQRIKVKARNLSQKEIDAIVAKSKLIKPSPPKPGSTTDPKEIARVKAEKAAAEDARKKGQVAGNKEAGEAKSKDGKAGGGSEIESMKAKSAESISSRNPNFNPTPNFPVNNPKVTQGVETSNSLAPADKSFYVYCNVTSGVNKNPVAGVLQVVDLKRKELVYNVQANRTQGVPLFNAGGKQKLFICDIFGYKKQDFDLNLDNIINDSTAQQVQIVDDTIVINFELRRLEKGDVAVAYNIFFYDDASVMLPKSTYELDQLLELMQENKKIRVKIHGHTNTSKLGKILYLDKNDKNFFRFTAKNKETFGPAKMLSKKRAETIKMYLESKKITEDRIETEGHGGSQMLYPNTHPLAFKNKRVEVEILEDK